MALYKTITVQKSTKVYIWKIDESFTELSKGISLRPFCQQRVESMKSETHQLGFLSVRHLLKEAGYSDFDVAYDDFGKPHLCDNHYISITHSYNFSGVIVSKKPVGIDIEKQRHKILKIAPKFADLPAYKTAAHPRGAIRKLTLLWGSKESVYKAMGIPGLAFRKNINVEDFNMEDRTTGAKVVYDNIRTDFELKFLEFEGFSCVYALSSKSVS